MADLLAQSREASARIRVENIINTDITVELMEILELYAELLLARAGLLDVRDKNIKERGGTTASSGDGSSVEIENTGLEEAAASIIYAAPRLPRDVRELGVVRNMLIERFGKDFAVRANENVDGCVPSRVVEKLKIDPPKETLVTAYLQEIARTYGVDWPRHRQELEDAQREVDEEDRMGGGGEDADDGDGGGLKEAPLLADPISAVMSTPKPNKIDLGSLQKATPPHSFAPGGTKSPVSVAPPGARSDNPSPKVRLPGGASVSGQDATSPTRAGASSGRGVSKQAGSQQTKTAGGPNGTVPTVDDLARRFQALKR